MKKLAIKLSVFLVLLCVVSLASAQQEGKLAQVGMAFLDIPVGTRAAAMGEAFVSAGNDVNALFWNPAGMSLVESRELAVNYNKWIADITHLSAAFAINIDKIGVFGASFVRVDYGSITGTQIASNTEGYEVTGDLNPGDYAIGIGFAKRVSNKFSFGVHAKYVAQDLGTSMSGYTASEVHEVKNKIDEPAFDFGTLFFTGFKDLRVAMSVRNFSREVGYRQEEFPMPLTFSFGLAMNVLSLTDMDEKHVLTVAADALHPRDYPERINLGMEYWFNNMVSLRAGYKFVTDEEGLTAGLGLRQKIGPMTVKIDYAYSDFGIFDQVHRTSMGIVF